MTESSQGKDFADPINLTSTGHIGKASHVDEYAAALLTFPGDIVAQLFAGLRANTENVLRIFGTDGSFLVPAPWKPGIDGSASKIYLFKDGDRSIFIATCTRHSFNTGGFTLVRACI